MTISPPMTWWLTGLSAAGKSTLAESLAAALRKKTLAVCILDGDVMRTGLSSDLGFSMADRAENIRRVAEVAKHLNDSGIYVIVALISPIAAERENARAIIGTARFVEVHVATPLAVCEQRDPKQLYKKARMGLVSDFTGVSAPYESGAYDLAVDTSVMSLAEATGILLNLLYR